MRQATIPAALSYSFIHGRAGQLTPQKGTVAHLEYQLVGFTDSVYTKSTRAHTHRELIREWRSESKGSSLGYI